MTVMSTTMPADAGPAPMGNLSASRLVVPKMTATQHIRAHIQHGISDEKAREITKFVKGLNVRVQSQVQKDQVRISSKKKDDLQAVIQALKDAYEQG